VREEAEEAAAAGDPLQKEPNEPTATTGGPLGSPALGKCRELVADEASAKRSCPEEEATKPQ
jgi:hypothetical protein